MASTLLILGALDKLTQSAFWEHVNVHLGLPLVYAASKIVVFAQLS